MSQLTASAKLFGTTTLDERQAALARKTYALLTLGVGGAIVGGHLGSQSLALAQIFSRPVGWLVALVLINVVPRLALWAAGRSAPLALAMLVLDGLLAGLVLAPLLLVARYAAPGVLTASLGVTLAVFIAITGYVMMARRRFCAPVGLMTGLFVGIVGAMVLNALLHIGLPGVMIAAGIGALGVLMLVHATSDVLNNPDFDNPIAGALMLFGGLFNIFVAVLNVLLRLRK
ncbi:MAG: Bax inhibitor-1 family protein [Myxococcales bacterium]|nr:Bax inhibitor-1 family protein [Myxococcota bacterium]MDW8282540.1 Bax inhibitor-1 family protein [Myxococcales bacterium]